MKYYIVTGASKGLGEAISEELMNQGNYVIGVARNESGLLNNLALTNTGKLKWYHQDLSEVNELAALMDKILREINVMDGDEISLINNAGIVAPIRPASRCKTDESVKNIHINLLAPIILCQTFIAKLQDLNIAKRIVNVSSGAGSKPFYGWSNYCAGKAGLDLFTQCVGIEEVEKIYPTHIIGFLPGVMDTNMQLEIRTSSKEDFVLVDQFANYKEEGNLRTPEAVAKAVIRALEDDNLNNGTIAHVSQYL